MNRNIHRLRKINILFLAKAYVLNSIFKRKYPLSISWDITKKCNQKCLYCIGNIDDKELNIHQRMEMVKQMAALGTKFISITGGEPLLINDTGLIINFAVDKGIFVKLNTNGFLLKDRIRELRKVSAIQLSLDGDRDINDCIRGKNSFDKAIEGLQTAIEYNIPVYLNSVISKYNYSSLDKVLHICSHYNVGAYFQPARDKVLGDNNNNNPVRIGSNEYKKAISALIEFKKNKRFKRLILNSLSGLKYLYNWPIPIYIRCSAARLTFRLDNKGRLYSCQEIHGAHNDVLEKGFKKAVEQTKDFHCDGCWCGTQLEFNLIMNLNLDAIINTFICNF